LLQLGDYYQVDALCAACENVLVRDMSVTNVAASLALSDDRGRKHLRAAALEFAAKIIEELLDTRDWQELALARPQLALDVMRAMAKNRKRSAQRAELMNAGE
jgi:hypothetical protein